MTFKRPNLDTLLHHLTLVAFGVLIAWSVIGLYGTLGGILEVDHQATLRFLFVVMIVVYAHHFVLRVRERKLRQLPPDERYGFTSDVDRIAMGSPQPEG
jgi:cytochrome c biogenesis protein CcdA